MAEIAVGIGEASTADCTMLTSKLTMPTEYFTKMPFGKLFRGYGEDFRGHGKTCRGQRYPGGPFQDAPGSGTPRGKNWKFLEGFVVFLFVVFSKSIGSKTTAFL